MPLNTKEGVDVKMTEVVDVKMSGVEVDRALDGVMDAESGGGTEKEVGLSPLEVVGH